MDEYRPFLAYAVAGGAILAGGFFLWTRIKSRKVPPTFYDPSVGRPLGVVEKLIFEGCDRGNAIMGNMVCIGSKEPLDEGKVREAIRRLINIHPLLHMRIVRRGSVLWFKPLQKAVVPLKVLGTSNWKSVLEDDILVKFDTNLEVPLWRVFYLPSAKIDEHKNNIHPHQCVLVFTINHAILDGISYIRLKNDLLNVMQEVQENKPHSYASSPLAPPLDEYIEPTLYNGICSKFYEFMFWLRVNFTPFRSEMIKPYLTFPSNPWVQKYGIEKIKDPDAPTKSCVMPYVMSKKDTSMLLEKCKDNKVTVQAVIQTAASFAASKLYNELDPEEKQTNLNVQSSVPVNVRAHFGKPIEPHHLGNYIMVSVFGTSVPAKPHDVRHFWAVAADVNQAVRNQVSNKIYMWYYNLCKIRSLIHVTSDELDRAMVEQKDTGCRYHTILLFSNLGNCSFLDRPDDCPVRLLTWSGTSAEHNIGSVFDNSLATFEGRLHWTMTYFPNITNKEVFDKYAQYTKDNIQALINSSF